MAKFLFVVPPFTGHINPTLSIGKELRDRGHTVAWFGVGESLKRIMPAEATLFLADEKSGLSSYEIEMVFQSILKVQNSSGAESFKYLYEDVLIPLSHLMRPSLIRVIDEFVPDVIINDQQAFMGAICAFEKGICYATSVTAPAAINDMSVLPKIAAWESQQVIALQQSCGIEADSKVICSDDLTLVFSSTDFIGHSNFPPHFRFVGPAIKHRDAATNFNWREVAQTHGPRVLITLGTFIKGIEQKFFSTVTKALAGEPITVVAIADPDCMDEWPDNFIVKPYIPQLEMLKYIDAVICHGGHNTVCETLLYGLPLIVIPYATDQFSVAGQVEQAGCGQRLRHSRLSPDLLRNSLKEILYNESYKNAAARIQSSFVKAGGTEAAAHYIERLVKKKVIDQNADNIRIQSNSVSSSCHE